MGILIYFSCFVLLIPLSIQLLRYGKRLCNKAKDKNIPLHFYLLNYYSLRNFYWTLSRQHTKKESFSRLIIGVDENDAKKYLFYEKIESYLILIILLILLLCLIVVSLGLILAVFLKNL